MPKRRVPTTKVDVADIAARSFCYALAEATAGKVGNWRMVASIADRLGVDFNEATTIADDCASREWIDHASHSVRLLPEGRKVALEVKALIAGNDKR